MIGECAVPQNREQGVRLMSDPGETIDFWPQRIHLDSFPQ